MYQPLLQPLLDAPGSTYKLIPKSGIVWGHLQKVFSEEHLPNQESFGRGDPRLEEPNDTLLFVANIGHYPKRGYAGFESIANLVLYQFMSAIRTHSLFQRYGQVRMLIWMADEEKDTLLPTTVSLRRKAAIEAEISCEKIQSIASGFKLPGAKFKQKYQRDDALELDRIRLRYEKMKETGLTTPLGRESDLLYEALIGKARDTKEEFKNGFTRELEALEAQYAAGELGDFQYKISEWGNKVYDKDTPQLKRLRVLRSYDKNRKGRAEKQAGMKREFDEILSIQREIYKMKPSEERQALENSLKQRTEAWTDYVSDQNIDDFRVTWLQIDDARIAGSDPPILMWDRRDFEPLKVHPGEFLPQREMCLLDIQPRALWPILRENFPDNYDVFEYIVGQLFIVPTQSVRKGLSALAPGAYEYLIAECPSLTDPTKGGSLDTEIFSVRLLTPEMLKEMVEAWVRWPFKPNKSDIMSRLGSTMFDTDTEVAEKGLH